MLEGERRRRHRRGRVPAAARRLRRGRGRRAARAGATLSDAPVRWAEMLAPQPRVARRGRHLSRSPAFPERDPEPIDVRDPRTRSFGHIDPANMEVDKQTQDMLAVSASMRTALLVYSGITVKMMVDPDLGAQLLTMFMVQYEPRRRWPGGTITRSRRRT